MTIFYEDEAGNVLAYVDDGVVPALCDEIILYQVSGLGVESSLSYRVVRVRHDIAVLDAGSAMSRQGVHVLLEARQ